MTQEDLDGRLEFLDTAYNVQGANSLCTAEPFFAFPNRHRWPGGGVGGHRV